MRTLLLTAFCLFQNIAGQAQEQIQMQLQSDQLFNYDPPPFKWHLEGTMQILLKQGINYLQEGNTEIALVNFNDYLKKDSSTWIAYFYRGICNKRFGQFKKAEKDLLKAISLNENSYESILEVAKINHLQLKSRIAEKYYSEAIKLQPLKPIAYLLKGDLQFAMGNLKDASKSYLRCVEKDSSFSDAKTKLRLIETFETKRNGESLPFLDRVLEVDSLNKVALIYRGLINLNLNPQKSLVDFNRLIKLSPENVNVRLLRGSLMIKFEEYENAFLDFQKALRVLDEFDYINIKGGQDNSTKMDFKNAIAYIARYLYGFSLDDQKEIKKAFCLLISGKALNSIKVLQSIRNEENYPLKDFLLAFSYEMINNYDSAKLYYEAALQVDNDIADAHKKVGIYCTNKGEWQKAENHFSEALALNPSWAFIHKLRAYARINTGNLNGAIADFNVCIINDSLDTQSRASRSKIYDRIGNKTAAAEDRIALTGFHVLNYSSLASDIEVLLLNGDTTKAIKYLDIYTKRVPSTAGYVFKLKILLKQKDWKRIPTEIDFALKTVNSAVYFRDEYSFLLMVKGLSYLNNKNEDAAEDQFSAAIEIDKTNGQAFLERGRLIMSQGKVKQALRDLKTALKLGMNEADTIISQLTETTKSK